MTTEEHRQRHAELHRALDELIADYLQYEGIPNGKLISTSTVEDLMKWSHRQTLEPTEGAPPPSRLLCERTNPADILLVAAHLALRSYQYGNASPQLAKRIADAIEAVIEAVIEERSQPPAEAPTPEEPRP